jgi:hypothetical protein
MLRSMITVALLCCAASALSAAEPPKELKTLIEQADKLLQQGRYLDYYKLTMHPEMRKASEQGGVSMGKLALIMERRVEVQTVFKKVFTHLKTAQCTLNKEKTGATFKLPKELGAEQLGNVLSFELVEGKWYVPPK